MPTTDGIELPAVAELRGALQAASRSDDGLYVLLDGASIPKLRLMLEGLAVDHLPLFRPSPREDLSHVAPFVARCAPDGDLATWLAIDRLVLEAAVFVVADAALETVHRHLRRFLLIEDHRRSPRYLRFYDPRVLPTFLASNSLSEQRLFFGPIRRLLAYDGAASLAAGRLRLRQWCRPGPSSEDATTPLPSATAKFRLRAEHEDAFARAAMERYDRRCVAYLRARHPERLRDKVDGEIRALVDDAKAVGDALGCVAGRDVTILAELLIVGLDETGIRTLEQLPPEDRAPALPELRDQLLQMGRA